MNPLTILKCNIVIALTLSIMVACHAPLILTMPTMFLGIILSVLTIVMGWED